MLPGGILASARSSSKRSLPYGLFPFISLSRLACADAASRTAFSRPAGTIKLIPVFNSLPPMTGASSVVPLTLFKKLPERMPRNLSFVPIEGRPGACRLSSGTPESRYFRAISPAPR
jgi:hypothetical protein